MPPSATISAVRGTTIPPIALVIPSVVNTPLVFNVPVLTDIVDNPSTILSVCPVGTIKPPFAVINPEIFALPTTSSGTEGIEVPIPMRALEPPTI
jgi:hypothetical protein